jgi:hypothetical protein
MLNGSAVSSIDSVSYGDVFSGVLADGSAFIFSGDEYDYIGPGTTTLQTVAVPSADTTPMVVSSGDASTKGLRAGQTLTITGDAQVRSGFDAIGGRLNIEGGSVGISLATLNTEVNITGGAVGDHFGALSGTTVNITGGSVGEGFSAREGSTVNISGGSVGSAFSAGEGSTVNIAGGSVERRFRAYSGSTVNITGGSFEGEFGARSGSTVNLFLLDALLDGVALDLMLGGTIEITQRDGLLLEATLADGTYFDLQLNPTSLSGRDFVALDATLTVTRVVPAPGGAAVLGLAGALALRRRR